MVANRQIHPCIWVLFSGIWLFGCRTVDPVALPIATFASVHTTVIPTPLPSTMSTLLPTPMPLPTVSSTPTVQPTATAQPTTTQSLTPTATPHPLAAFTIAGMRTRPFAGGQIVSRALLDQTTQYTRHAIDYPSDGLTITGLMYVPTGDAPFPVLILLHGYVDRDHYVVGMDSWQAAEFFAAQGYLVLAPDLRSWGQSDSGLSLFHMGLVADVLNLIGSLPTLPQADVSKIGLWGHSMGGGIATKVLTIDERVGSAVLYAPNSADDADLIARWGAGCFDGQIEILGKPCNPADVIPADTPSPLVQAYFRGAADPDFLRQVAPIYHLASVSAPVQIHIGSADGQHPAATPPEWSAKLAEALESAERDVTYYTYAGQSHFFTGESWTTLLTRALTLYDRELKHAP